MTALTSPRNTREALGTYGCLVAGATIQAGALVAVNTSGAAVPASDTKDLVVVGVAQHSAASGEKVNYKRGAFCLNGSTSSAVTAAKVGSQVMVADDNTVAAASTNSVVAGKCLAILEDGEIVVQVG